MRFYSETVCLNAVLGDVPGIVPMASKYACIHPPTPPKAMVESSIEKSLKKRRMRPRIQEQCSTVTEKPKQPKTLSKDYLRRQYRGIAYKFYVSNAGRNYGDYWDQEVTVSNLLSMLDRLYATFSRWVNALVIRHSRPTILKETETIRVDREGSYYHWMGLYHRIVRFIYILCKLNTNRSDSKIGAIRYAIRLLREKVCKDSIHVSKQFLPVLSGILSYLPSSHFHIPTPIFIM